MARAGEKPSRPPDRPPGDISAPEPTDQVDRFWLDEFGTRPPGTQPDEDGGRPDEQSAPDSVPPSDLSWLDEYTGEARRQSLLDRWEERQEELKRATAQRLQELRAARAQRPRRQRRKRKAADKPPPKAEKAEPKAPAPRPTPPSKRPRPHEDFSHVPPPPPPIAKRLTRKPAARAAPTRLRPGHRRRIHPERIKGLTRLTVLLSAVVGAVLLVAPWFGVEIGGGSETAATSSLVPGQQIVGSTARSVTAGPFFPVRGRFYYGEGGARFGASRGGRAHAGQDVFSGEGAPLVAVRDGVVVDRGGTSGRYAGGKGNYLAIYSPVDRLSYVYFHMLRPPKLKRGDRVSAGQRVGAMGCTGSCYGVHLHFEIRLGRATLRSDRKAVDPLPFLKRWDKADPGARKTGYGRY